MTSLWARWLAFLDEKDGPLPLALARVAFGVVAFATVASPILRGVFEGLYLPPQHGGMVALGRGTWLVAALGGPTPGVVWTLAVASLVSSALLVVGLGGRVVAFLALQSFMGLVGLNGTASCSHTILITNALWLLVLGDSTATLSLDRRLKSGSWWSDAPVAAWPRRLMILQIVFVYFMAGAHKVSGHWLPFGDLGAVYYILRAPQWSTVTDPALVVALYPLTQVATLATWVFEWTSPLLLVWALLRRSSRGGRLARFARRVDARVPFALVGLGMHLGIEATMNVGPFSFASMAYYLALWRHDEIVAFVDALRARRFR